MGGHTNSSLPVSHVFVDEMSCLLTLFFVPISFIPKIPMNLVLSFTT